MESALTIYKASAGSGKTFRLAVEYIKLLIQNPKLYRNILAVTFTNKATAEMKSRILSELYGLANNLSESSIYLQTIAGETHKSEDEICHQAKQALTFILHDYSSFRVETIDSFFQNILRNMAKELGLGANFNISLNDKEIRANAISLMIEQADRDKVLMSWLKNYIANKIEDNKSWNVEKDIDNFYTQIISEKFKAQQDIICNRISEKEFLQNTKTMLNKQIETENAKMKSFSDKFFLFVENNGLSVADFYQKGSGVHNYFTKIAEGKYLDEIFKKHVKTSADNADKWIPKKKEFTSIAEVELIPLLLATETQREQSAKLVNTSNLVLDNLNNLGLLNDILGHISEYNKSNNIFALSDTSSLLAKMIGNNDSSFIFEKIGTSLRHIMIDEFQDTSQLQWENFQNLLIECISQGYSNLIVGDVKQAIYRWRNGNWQILNNIENNSYLKHYNPKVETLNSSWRSAKNIVEFNNTLFTRSVDIVNAEFIEQFNENCSDFEQAYSDIQQEAKKDAEGYVNVEFLETENYQENTLNALVAQIEQLQEGGVNASDIAILVRKKDHGKDIANFIDDYKNKHSNSKYCYNLISNETFVLESSLAVAVIINALHYLKDSSNSVAEANLAMLYQKNVLNADIAYSQIFGKERTNLIPPSFKEDIESLKLMPLYELVEQIALIFEIEKIDENSEYLFSFFDNLNEYLKTESSDIATFLNFWDESLKDQSVATSGEAPGIKILTIHKSKGLEFHSVIIPFCDWTTTTHTSNAGFLWCESTEEPFAHIGMVPVKYSSKMLNSFFAEEYKKETMQLLVDNINLLYVATTRAENNLIILAKESKGKISTVADVLYSVLGGEHFTQGNIAASKAKQVKTSENKLNASASPIEVKFTSNNIKVDFRQSNRSREFIKSENTESHDSSYIDRGKLLHSIFSAIHTADDINSAVNKLILEGIIQQKEATELIAFIENAIEQSQVQEWFAGKYTLFNECAIITKTDLGEITSKRPDRVMLGKDETIIIDFKFGKANKTHNIQVLEYMYLLKEMGYKNISGFLWYVDDNVVQKVSN